MSRRRTSPPASERERYDAEVAAYVAVGGSRSVQRVVTAVQRLDHRLSRWYTQQLADVGLTGGEWGVLSHLAIAPEGSAVTPSVLADALAVAPSSMTHRLDRMSERGLISREQDPSNRTRVLVSMTSAGWVLFRQVVQDSNVMESDVLEGLDDLQREQLAELLELAIGGLDDALAADHDGSSDTAGGAREAAAGDDVEASAG